MKLKLAYFILQVMPIFMVFSTSEANADAINLLSPRSALVEEDFISENVHQIFLLNIIQPRLSKLQPDKSQLEGFFIESDLNDDGSIQQEIAPIYGLRIGKTFTAGIRPTPVTTPVSGPDSISGVFADASVSIIGLFGAKTVDMNLRRVSGAEYLSDFALLKQRGATIQKDNALEAEKLRQLAAKEAGGQQAVNALKASEAKAAADAAAFEQMITIEDDQINAVPLPVLHSVAELNADAQKITDETAKMQHFLQLEKKSGGKSDAKSAALAATLNAENLSEANQIDGLHRNLVLTKKTGILALLSEVNQTAQQCRDYGITVIDHSSFSGPTFEMQSCVIIEEQLPFLQSEVDNLMGAYQNVFSTWANEDQKQRAIIKQLS